MGRKDCTVTIAEDASISRVHADLVVKPLPRESLPHPTHRCRLLLKDLSKFGTRVNGERVDKARAGDACMHSLARSLA